MANANDVDGSDVCVLCLKSYRHPKFLPTCYHTYCARCIKEFADLHKGDYFPCPTCRKLTLLPEGGVSALQSNFYIKGDKSRRRSKGRNLCTAHVDENLKYYCVKCDKAICFSCKLTKHEQHETEDLHAATDRKRKELTRAMDRLQRAVTAMTQRVEASKEEQQAMVDKKAAVEKNIYQRHAAIVAAADKFRDEALDSLFCVGVDIESRIAEVLKQQEDKLKKLLNIHQEVEKAISCRTGNDVITAATEVKRGRGSEQAVSKLLTEEKIAIYRPVLRFNVATDVMAQKVQDYLGTVTKTAMEAAVPDMTVVERFRCGKETDIEVFSLCPADEDPPAVWVSYQWSGLKEDTAEKKFSENGEFLNKGAKKGKISNIRFAKGKCLSSPSELGVMSTFSKSLTSTAHYRLRNNLSGVANVYGFKVISASPFQTVRTVECSLRVGAHRAFDVDDSEQFFVVVEEAKLPDMRRKVRLYRRTSELSVSTYSPPTSSFQPSDVCFYRLGGQQVLLVTDELNDAIHVVQVQNCVMKFVRYLAPGCTLLIQPTAINVDVFGRLWLACRGGNIISMEPKA